MEFQLANSEPALVLGMSMRCSPKYRRLIRKYPPLKQFLKFHLIHKRARSMVRRENINQEYLKLIACARKNQRTTLVTGRTSHGTFSFEHTYPKILPGSTQADVPRGKVKSGVMQSGRVSNNLIVNCRNEIRIALSYLCCRPKPRPFPGTPIWCSVATCTAQSRGRCN